MHWFLKLIIIPLLDALAPKVIVEVGVEVGAVTRPLLDWASEHDALLHCIDPDPNLNVEELIAEYGERLRFHRATSLEVLGELDAVDVALIDGDHNWYTVINELRALERRAVEEDRASPVVLLHDVGWPYGRRDLYYDPASISEAHRQPHARMGIHPGRSELGHGLNDHLENALLDNTPANGVMTAVEDFISESAIAWRFLSLPGLSGLAILVPQARLEQNPALTTVLAGLDTPELLRALCEAIEAARIDSELKRAAMTSRLTEAQLRQVMQRVDPEELIGLYKRVRELEDDRRELERRVQEGEEARAQMRLLTEELSKPSGERSSLSLASAQTGTGSAHTDKGHFGADTQARFKAQLIELRTELELASAQRLSLQSALTRARVQAELAEAEREAMAHRLTRLLSEHDHAQAPSHKSDTSNPASANGLSTSTSKQTGSAAPGQPDSRGEQRPEQPIAAAGLAELAAAEGEREARAIFLDQFLPVLERALPEQRERDPLALPSAVSASAPLQENGEREAGQPSVDVVVCVRDALDDLRLCLWSLTHKTDRPFRLIVVDDGSAEETREYLEELARSLPAMKLIRRDDSPHGYTLAANAGLRASSGDYVILLNSDTVVSHEWLRRIVSYGERHEHVGILGPLSNAASHQSVPELRHEGRWSTNPLPDWLTVDGAALAVQRDAPRVDARLPFLNGFCYVIKRAVLEAVGLLDEESFPDGYCEENDYSQRARDAGFELAVVDDAYVYHAKSRSFGTAGREELAKRNYQIFRSKHGPEQIDGLVAAMEADTTLELVRTTFRERTSDPAALAALLGGDERRMLSITFVLPGLAHGGSGGSHSVYQEVKGLRALGVDAHIALPRWDMDRAKAVYQDAEEIFQAFTDGQDLAVATAGADVISATHYKSVALLKAVREVRESFLPAYYVQDYEPFFTAPYIAEEAIASYTALPDMLLFAKSHWLCNVVAQRHGLPVAKVEPSIDELLFRTDERTPGAGPLRIAAMIRPRTARRQPHSTLTVLMRLLRELPPESIELVTFGCYSDELREIAPGAGAIIEHHRGLLSREQVAQALRGCDVFLDMSIYQAFGRTALEAMACGCTVVAPAVGGVWEFLEDGKNGFGVDTMDPDRVFDVLASLSRDRAILEDLKAGALRTAARYSISRAALSEYLTFERAHRLRFGDLTQTPISSPPISSA
jgi:GT2 family glycosyltransferase/glycosyltransferase involved in cell wall biosynthesis